MSDWQAALQNWITRPRKGIVTDVDGTISPIVNQPEAAQVTATARDLLARLHDSLDLVAVVSGRAAADVQARVGVPGVVYVGNHGLERWRDGEVEVPPQIRQYRPQMQAMLADLQMIERPGMLLEDKNVTLTFHYRNVDDPPQTADELRPKINALGEKHGLAIYEGRMIFEVRPPLELNKGTAFKMLVDEYELDAALYIGDDVTDVDALQAARQLRSVDGKTGYAFGVAASETPSSVVAAADFLLDGVSGVESLLAWLSNALSRSSS